VWYTVPRQTLITRHTQCQSEDNPSKRQTRKGILLCCGRTHPEGRVHLALCWTAYIQTDGTRKETLTEAGASRMGQLYVGAQRERKDPGSGRCNSDGRYRVSHPVPQSFVPLVDKHCALSSRFLNHSCDPNCLIQLVRWGPRAFPRPVIFVGDKRLSRADRMTAESVLVIRRHDERSLEGKS
jgi:hypothetical protein